MLKGLLQELHVVLMQKKNLKIQRNAKHFNFWNFYFRWLNKKINITKSRSCESVQNKCYVFFNNISTYTCAYIAKMRKVRSKERTEYYNYVKENSILNKNCSFAVFSIIFLSKSFKNTFIHTIYDTILHCNKHLKWWMKSTKMSTRKFAFNGY